MKNISQCKRSLTRRWHHSKITPLQITLFSIWRLKTALRKQRYLCQRFQFPIPIHTWKISWIERLIYFFAATHGKSEPFDSDERGKSGMSCNSVYHFFLLLPSSHAILGVRKHASVALFDLTVQKIEDPFNRSKKICIRSAVQPCRLKKIYIHSAVRLNCSIKNYICSAVRLNRSKKICIRSAVEPIRLSVRLPCIQLFERIS